MDGGKVDNLKENKIALVGWIGRYGEMLAHLLKRLPFGRLRLHGDKKVNFQGSLSETNPECKLRCYKGKEHIGESIKGADIIVLNDENTVEGDFHQKASMINEYACNIAAYNPKAVIVVGLSEVNLALPLLSEALSKLGVLDPGRLLGVTGGDSAQASAILGAHLKVSSNRVFLPVVGGSSPETRVPLFSKTRPKVPLHPRIRQKLLAEMKIYVDPAKKVEATARLVESVLVGDRMETALTQTDMVTGAEFFSLPLLLGPEGVRKRIPLPRSLSAMEEGLIAHAVKSLAKDVSRAKSLVNTDLPPGTAPSSSKFTRLKPHDPPQTSADSESNLVTQPLNYNAIDLYTESIPELMDTINSQSTFHRVHFFNENDSFQKTKNTNESHEAGDDSFSFSFCCGPLKDLKMIDDNFQRNVIDVLPNKNLTDNAESKCTMFLEVIKTNMYGEIDNSIKKLKPDIECLKNTNIHSVENNKAALSNSDCSNIEKIKIPMVKEKINESSIQNKTVKSEEVGSKFIIPSINTKSDLDECPSCINNSLENCSLDLTFLIKNVEKQSSSTLQGPHDDPRMTQEFKSPVSNNQEDVSNKHSSDVKHQNNTQDKTCTSPVSTPLNQEKILSRFSERSTISGKWSKKHTEHINKNLPINKIFRFLTSKALNKNIDKTKNIREKQRYKPQTDVIRELLGEKKVAKGNRTVQTKESPTANILKRSNFAKVKLEKLKVSTSDDDIMSKRILERQRRLILSVKTHQFNEGSKITLRSNNPAHFHKVNKNSVNINPPQDHFNKSLSKTKEKVMSLKKSQDPVQEKGMFPTSEGNAVKSYAKVKEVKGAEGTVRPDSLKDGEVSVGGKTALDRAGDKSDQGLESVVPVSDTAHCPGGTKRQELLLLAPPSTPVHN